VIDLPSAFLALVSAFLLFKLRLNSAWLVLGGAVAGWVVKTVFSFQFSVFG
jgi:chromate transporter